MKYKFRVENLWAELKAVIGDIPVNITDSGDEMILDFGKITLTLEQKTDLINLIEQKPLLRGKTAKFVGEGEDLNIISSM